MNGIEIKTRKGRYWDYLHLRADSNHELIVEENTKKEVIVSVRFKA